MSDPFRVYSADECGKDGYPWAWHELAGDPKGRVGGTGVGVKDLVREQAGNRCVRCHHPYAPGAGQWSRCDERCVHSAVVCRIRPAPVGWPTTPADILREDREGFRQARTYEVDAAWRILTVHHLRLGAEAKRDLRWWNLCALCQRCHLQIQGKVQMERIWPWPHSPWFRPYAAGWYAFTYLGEDLTREQTIARLDELLALELIEAP